MCSRRLCLVQVPPYFPSDASVHITQGNHLMGIEKAKMPMNYSRETHFEQASTAPQHYAQPELMHPQHHLEEHHPPHSAHPGHPPLPPGARRTYRGRQVELAQVCMQQHSTEYAVHVSPWQVRRLDALSFVIRTSWPWTLWCTLCHVIISTCFIWGCREAKH